MVALLRGRRGRSDATACIVAMGGEAHHRVIARIALEIYLLPIGYFPGYADVYDNTCRPSFLHIAMERRGQEKGVCAAKYQCGN